MQPNLIQLPYIALYTNGRGGQDKGLANVLPLQSCINSSLNNIMLLVVCSKLGLLLAQVFQAPALSFGNWLAKRCNPSHGNQLPMFWF